MHDPNTFVSEVAPPGTAGLLRNLSLPHSARCPETEEQGQSARRNPAAQGQRQLTEDKSRWMSKLALERSCIQGARHALHHHGHSHHCLSLTAWLPEPGHAPRSSFKVSAGPACLVDNPISNRMSVGGFFILFQTLPLSFWIDHQHLLIPKLCLIHYLQ